MTRPGPPELEAGLAPGGLVVRIYTAVDEYELVAEQYLTLNDDPEALALEAALATQEVRTDDVCLVVYDGDTGERWSALAILEALRRHHG